MFFIPQNASVFPPVSQADEIGLLAWGGLVTPQFVLDALSHGIFPWTMRGVNFSPYGDNDKENAMIETETSMLFESLSPQIQNATWNGFNYHSLRSMSEVGDKLCWFAPNQRGILELNEIHIPSRLQRKMRGGKFIVTFDQAFPEVMLGCALSGARQKECSWIHKEFFCGYCKLFELGWGHSAECWLVENDDEKQNSDNAPFPRRLVGGVYGVAINSFFAGESMFSIETDASKIALFSLLLALKKNGFRLFDLQVLNPHTKSLGGKNISREDYMKRLHDALRAPALFQE